jgi:organic radical activating enzyme
MIRTILISETFASLEGEQIFSGLPTVYVRVAKCNKKCPLFNNHNKEISDTGYAKVDFNPGDILVLKDVPVIPTGCDTQYAVNPEFSHLWKEFTVDELIDNIMSMLPHNAWINPISHQPVILSLTGGEPMLYMKFFTEELLQHPKMQDCKHILMETNASIPVRDSDLEAIVQWCFRNDSRWTWSNSPKLSNSGETWKSSIKPNVLLSQMNHSYIGDNPHKFTQYLKFVTDGSDQSIAEIEKATAEYYKGGVPLDIEVGLMPEAATAEQQMQVMRHVADVCMQRGYRFVLRLQNILWGNAIGT